MIYQEQDFKVKFSAISNLSILANVVPIFASVWYS